MHQHCRQGLKDEVWEEQKLEEEEDGDDEEDRKEEGKEEGISMIGLGPRKALGRIKRKENGRGGSVALTPSNP